MAWDTADEERLKEYSARLSAELELLEMPKSLECNDAKCTDSKHTAERDTFVLDVMSKIIEVSHAVIQLKPAPRSSDQVRLPGWAENVEPLKQDAKFWYTPNYLLLW